MKIDVSKPKIEVISHDEVYLLDPEGNRTKRICGAKREGIPGDFPCVELAGLNTTHSGVGKCHLHNKSLEVAKKISTYHKMIEVNIENKTLKDFLNLTETQDVEDLTSVDPEIKLLQGMISMRLSGQEGLSAKDATDVSRMIEKLGRLKSLKVESAKKAQLDFTVVNKLLKGIIMSIRMHVSPEAAKRVIADVITTTVNPMMSSGDVSYGDINELKKLSGKRVKDLQ